MFEPILGLDLVRWESPEYGSNKAMTRAEGINDGSVVINQSATDDNWVITFDEELPCGWLEHHPISKNNKRDELLVVLKVQHTVGRGINLRLYLPPE